MHDVEQAIRERAYHLWVEGGRQHGLADQYWLAAQRSILGALLGANSEADARAKPKKAKAPRKTRAA